MIVVGLVASKVVSTAWKLGSGGKPPKDGQGEYLEVMSWAAASAAAAAAVKLFAERRAAAYYLKSTGHAPPGYVQDSTARQFLVAQVRAGQLEALRGLGLVLVDLAGVLVVTACLQLLDRLFGSVLVRLARGVVISRHGVSLPSSYPWCCLLSPERVERPRNSASAHRAESSSPETLDSQAGTGNHRSRGRDCAL